MNVQNKIDFTVKETRADYYNHWVIREVAIGIFAIAIITTCSWAIKDINALSKLTHLNMASLPIWSYKIILVAGSILGFRTFVFRPLVGLIIRNYIAPQHIYPINKRYSYYEKVEVLKNPSWDEYTNGKTNLTWKAYDGKLIHGCQLDGVANAKNSGKFIIFCLGNAQLYDHDSLLIYGKLRAEGYNLIFYYPPGYGSSDGPRTPLSDFYALEAIMQYLQNRQITADNIEIQAISIGSGVASSVCAKYPVNRIKLCVPFCTIEGVMEHLADQFVPWIISKIGTWLVSSILRDVIRYDNGNDLANSRVNYIHIDEAGRDNLMSLGYGPTEADKIFKICKEKIFPNTQIEFDENTQFVTKNTRLLYLTKWEDEDHNGLATRALNI